MWFGDDYIEFIDYFYNEQHGELIIEGNCYLYPESRPQWLTQCKTVIVKDGITTIGSSFFENCTNLEKIVCESVTPCNLAENAFYGVHASIYVPVESVEAYRTAWSDYSHLIVNSDLAERTVEVSAMESGSALRAAIGDALTTEVVELTVKGTINSYDIIVLNDKMPRLHKLDLSEAAIVASTYPYYESYCTENNVVGQMMFYNNDNISHIVLPKEIYYIKEGAFHGCDNLRNVEMFDKVTTFDDYVFDGCGNLRQVRLSEALTAIPNRTFRYCYSLQNIEIPERVTEIGYMAFYNTSLQSVSLPPNLKSIGSWAFESTPLQEVRIPSSVESIGGGAFNCSNLVRVYSYTIEPLSISEETFSNAANATLYAPTQSRENYYFAQGWKGFLTHVNFDEPYESFYLNGDLTLNDNTGYIDGKDDEKTDAEIREEAGLEVEGEQADSETPNQQLGNVDVKHDGNGNGGSIIGDNNLQVDSLNIQINVTGGRWYFFAFPFDIKMSDITTANGCQYVFRYYDGAVRAEQGSGGWKDVTDDYLEAARGYIFQAASTTVLQLTVSDVRFKKEDKYKELVEHVTENMSDASWNFIGNPYLSYYDMSETDYTSPVTIWDGEKYVAIRPGDDDYHFAPYEAFFVQKPEDHSHMGYEGDKQMTGRESEAKMAEQQAARHMQIRLAANGNVKRRIVNLTLSDGNSTDRARIVFNEQTNHNYERACDAAKFTTEGMPQLYTLDNEQVRYAINERPAGNGIVTLGFYAPTAGTYTIGAPRMDAAVCLRDLSTGAIHDFAEGDYSFTTQQGTNNRRFEILLKQQATGIDGVTTDEMQQGELRYDMSGRQLQQLQRGVNIVNGKKVLVK